jgi:PHD/YefM family antitoxin component YafN of YafNO toxin-antitoxin module
VAINTIQGMEDVRSKLPSIVERLNATPGQAVHFGRHRRDEAVITSAAEYDRLTAAAAHLEELERLGAVSLVSDRLADGRFLEGTVDELFAAADG